MVKVTVETIKALVNTASALEIAPDYQWGHMGSCNCGFLAREVARLDRGTIHRAAMQRYGNWTEQLNDYCPTSGFLMDDVITTMLNAGFDIDDLRHLETLSNAEILRTLPAHQRFLQHNVRGDVVTYLRAWSAWLTEQLPAPAIQIQRGGIVPSHDASGTCLTVTMEL
jgi:hypothetical protein